jgi:hypothetical protein
METGSSRKFRRAVFSCVSKKHEKAEKFTVATTLGEGKSGTLLKEQSCHDLDISIRGTKGLSKRPACIGTERTRTHLLFYSYSVLLYSVLFYSILTTMGEDEKNYRSVERIV